MEIRVQVAGDPESGGQGWSLILKGKLEGSAGPHGTGTFSAQEIAVSAWVAQPPVQLVAAYPPAPIELPGALIIEQGPGEPYRLRTFAEITGELQNRVFKTLRDEALRRLRAVELAWNFDMSSVGGAQASASFLGLTAAGGVLVRGRAVINLLGVLDPAEAAAFGGLHADISVQLFFGASLVQGGATVTAERSCSLHLRLRAQAALALSLDELNLSLPEIPLTLPTFAGFDLRKFQPLEIPGVAQAFEDLAGILGRLGRYLGGDFSQLNVAYEWRDANNQVIQPMLALHYTEGALLFAVAAPGFTVDHLALPEAGLLPRLARFTARISNSAGTLLVTVSNGMVASGTQAKVFIASVQVEPVQLPPIPADRKVMGPLEFQWSDITVTLVSSAIAIGHSATLEPGNLTLRARINFSRVAISLVNDPGTVLAFSGEIEITPSGTRVTRLALLEPYPLELVHQAGASLLRGARQVLQVLAQLKPGAGEIEKLKQVLRVVSKIAGAIAHAGAFVANAAAESLAKAGAAVAELVSALFEKLVDFLGNLPHNDLAIDIEIRVALDPIELRQVMITWSGAGHVNTPSRIEALGFCLEIAPGWRPALLLDVVNEPGVYFMAVRDPAGHGPALASLSTDLWLRNDQANSVEAVRDARAEDGARPDPDQQNDNKPLLQITALDRRDNGRITFVLAGLRRGRGVFLKRALQEGYRVELPSELPSMRVLEGPFVLVNPTYPDDVDFKIDFQLDRVLPFFGMGETGTTTNFLKDLKDKLGQVVSVKGTDGPAIRGRKAEFGLLLEVKAAGLTTELRLAMALNLDTFEVSFSGPTDLPLLSRRIEERALGLTWIVEQVDPAKRLANAEVKMFQMSFANGESGFELNSAEARMELRFEALSSDGEGVVLRVDTFKVGRSGLDLVAKVTDKPVQLNGVDVPFRFTTGGLTIRSGKLVEAVIGGRGQLPPALIGEADCTINLTFAQASSGIILQSGKVEIDKKGEPIICHATRFTLTITDLDIGFVADGGYHFYFLITGTLRFTPKPGEFTSGLLKYLDDVEFALERVPLTSDPRVLLRHISFQKALNPKREATLFNIFRFELRGFGFHPASPKFGGDPAINISGQINMGFGDVMQPKIDFHGLWIAPPRAGESLPRIRADGLGVELQMAGAVKVRGTLLAIDEDTRTVEGREIMPPGYNASGFLGEGAVDIPGWGSMQATLGFLEVASLQQPAERKHSFFLYLQANQLAIEIPTPFWTFYLREVGFGFGFRYTLAGIKQAERATSAAELVRTLDEVSKYQGDLHRFSAWNPDPEGTKFTLALKGAIQTAPAEDSYDADREKRAENPFLFDLVVALRSDFTFLMSARIHLGVNYFHYQENKDDFRARPHMRGFFYISVPRRELLLRSVSDPKGFIGEDSLLFRTGSILRLAVQAVQFSATLYIRPGLFQYELGWPDQLSVTLVNTSNMRVRVFGGMIFRAAEDGLLYGFNVGAEAFIRFAGSVGRSIGVSVEASLEAKLTARFIAYLAWRFSDSLVYALVSLDARLKFSVSAWMEIDLGFTSFTLRIGFSFSVSFSAAVELAITPGGIGGHVHARIAVQAFGCTLSVGIGFTFNNSRLEDARARVARFMAMSITADEPATSPVFAAQSGDAAILADAQTKETAAKAPAVPVVPEHPDVTKPKPAIVRSTFGRPLKPTNFWLLLRRADRPPPNVPVLPGQIYAYATLLPVEAEDDTHGGFYAAPTEIPDPANTPWQRAPLSLNAHRIVADQAFQLHAYNPADAMQAFSPIAGPGYDAPARWAAPVTNDVPAGRFTLAHLFDECFLADTKWTYLPTGGTAEQPAADRIAGNWHEPFTIRRHQTPQPLAPGDRKTPEQQRGQHQKEQEAEAALHKFDENAFQNRSTVLTMFLDQFVALSRDGERTDVRPSTTRLAHITDLGLVFFGELNELLKLDGATVIKKDDSADPPPGVIKIFNPRDDWFDNVDPILAEDRQAVQIDGIKLDWRLQVPFASPRQQNDYSRSNPEQYLHHYEITRTLEGFESEPATVLVKPTATIGGRKGDDVQLVSPDWQFVDSLDGELAVPAGVREALLPPAAGTDTLAAAAAWLKAFPDQEEVTITYTVTPVDIAGVRGLPKSFVVDVQRPRPAVRPALAELRVRQEFIETAPPAADDARPNDLQIYVALTDGAWDDDLDHEKFGNREYNITRHYRLVLQSEEIEPSGHYGSDGATARLRSSGTLATARRGGELHFEIAYADTRPPTPRLVPKKKGNSFAGPFLNEIEPDEEVRNKFGRWARLTKHRFDDDLLPDALQGEEDDLLDALWSRDGVRVATRFALETIVRITRIDIPNQQPRDFVSQRVPVQIEHVLGRVVEKPGKGEPRLRAAATVRPEALEWPRPLNLPPPGPGQVQAEGGFLRLRVPRENATLEDWVRPTPDHTPILVRDAERRILTTVRFAAIPEGIQSPQAGNTSLVPADAALIANYDLYELDLDQLAATGATPPALEKNAKAWQRSRCVGRIEQLARDEADLTPDSNKELNGWQAHYPSETCRLLAAAPDPLHAGESDRPMRAGWYSARETTALFPLRRPRLRFFPQAPEDAVTELMRGGQPTRLIFQLRVAEGSNAATLSTGGWTIPPVRRVANRIGAAEEDGRFVDFEATLHFSDPTVGVPTVVTCTDNAASMDPSHVRHALLAAGFIAFERQVGFEEQADPLAAWLVDPSILEGLELVVTGEVVIERLTGAQTTETVTHPTGTITLALDLRSPVHPLLEELLGELTYKMRDGSALYRAFNVMVQPPPVVTATELANFMAKTPPAADPYGWGILQSLGLATAIRIFDIDQDEFLPPGELARRVEKAFTLALARWNTAHGPDRFVGIAGQPFVEIHLKPGRDREAGPFDSVLDKAVENEPPAFNSDDDALSLLQLSLRPQPVPAWRYSLRDLKRRATPPPVTTPTDWTVTDPMAWEITDKDHTPVMLAAGTVLHGTLTPRPRVQSLRLEIRKVISGGHLARLRGGAIAELPANANAAAAVLPMPTGSATVDVGQIDPELQLVIRLPDHVPPPADDEISVLLDVTTNVEVRVLAIDGIVGRGPYTVLQAPDLKSTTVTQTTLLSDSTSPLEPDGIWKQKNVPAEQVPDPFERFEELPPFLWAAAFGGAWDGTPPTTMPVIPAARDAYQSFLDTLKAAAAMVVAPKVGSLELPPVVGPFVLWLQRFLDSGAGRSPGNLAPLLALAAPIRALPWKLAPDADGSISLSLMHSDRWSHSRAYAVKPISRYHRLLESLGVPAQLGADVLAPEETVTGTAIGYGVSVSPRTEKIEPPVILGTRRTAWPQFPGDENDGLEIIVARHGEESLAWSNRALFARLGVPTSLLSFARVYRFPEWLARLNEIFSAQIEPKPLPELFPVPASRPITGPDDPGDPRRQITGEILADIVKEYPRLWKGAQIWRLDSIAPHYKVAAVAAERAGVVVSKVAAVLHDDLPRRPLADRQDELLPRAVLTLEDVGNGVVCLILTHPLITHAHVTPAAASFWSSPANRQDISWWPDPDIVYVLQRRSPADTGAGTSDIREEDLEIRLDAFPAEGATPRLAQARARGTRFQSATVPVATLDPAPAPIQFSLQSTLELRPPTAGALKIDSLRLAEDEWQTADLVRAFNVQAASFGAILTPHTVSVDLPPALPAPPAPNETAAAYFARLKAFAVSMKTALEIGLAPAEPWQTDRLRVSVQARLGRLDAWLQAKETQGIQPADTPQSLHDAAELPVVGSGVYALGRDKPTVGPEVQWTESPLTATSEVYLLVWNIAPTTTIEALEANTFPPVAHADGRLQPIVARRIMGSAKSFWLRAIDGRARLGDPLSPQLPPGIVERQVTLPPWLQRSI